MPAEEVEKERGVLREQALESGKPEKVVEKMVEGRLGKFYGEVVLGEQEHMVAAEGGRVDKVLQGVGKELGGTVRIDGFALALIGK